MGLSKLYYSINDVIDVILHKFGDILFMKSYEAIILFVYWIHELQIIPSISTKLILIFWILVRNFFQSWQLIGTIDWSFPNLEIPLHNDLLLSRLSLILLSKVLESQILWQPWLPFDVLLLFITDLFNPSLQVRRNTILFCL